MRKAFAGFVAAIVTLALCGCVSYQENVPGETAKQGVPAVSPADEPVHITVSLPTKPDAPLTSAVSALALEYAEQTGVSVTVRGAGGKEQAVLTELLGAQAAEIYLIPAGDLEGYARQGLLASLSGTPMDYLTAVLHEAAVAWCRWDGSLWGMPYLGYTAALGTNTRLLDEAGVLSPPANWESFESACMAVQAQTEAAGIAGVAGRSEDVVDLLLGLIGSAGGSVLAEQEGRMEITADSPPVRTAVSFYMRLLQQYATAESDQNGYDRAAQEALLGRAAMFWAYPAHIAALEQASFPVGSALLPEGSGGSRALLHSYVWVMPRQIEEHTRSEAEGLIRFLLAPEQCDRVLRVQYDALNITLDQLDRDALLLPLLSDTDAIAFYREHPIYRPFAEAAGQALPPVPGKKWEQIEDHVLLPVFRSILLEEVGLEEGLQSIDADAGAILMN